MLGIAGAIETQVAVRDPQAVTASDFMPLMTIEQAVQRKDGVNLFIKKVMIEGEDYGAIPGAGTKKVLLKPGAEKLCSIFGMSVTYAEDKIIEDWTGDKHGGEALFYYSYRCQLSRGGKFMGEAIGSCNSWESKYRYRWVPIEVAKLRKDFDALQVRGGVTSKFEADWAIERKESTGQYGKPESYWQLFEDGKKNGTAKRVKDRKMGQKKHDGWEITMDQTQYRVPNPEISDTINTVQKMAQKRALVAAVLVVTNCSDAFTQDIEDFEDHAPQHQAAHEPAPADRASDAPAEAKVETKPEDPKNRPVPVPVPILALYEKVVKNRGVFGKACEELADRMIAKAGKAGEDAYAEVAAKFNKLYPRGTTDLNVLKGMLIDLYEAGEALQSTDTALADLPRPFGGQ